MQNHRSIPPSAIGLTVIPRQPALAPNNRCNNNTLCNKLIRVNNQPIELVNLPAEIKQTIAFKLNAESYTNLRLTSINMQKDLPSYQMMLNSLKKGCSGSIKKEYSELHKESIIRELDNLTDQTLIHNMKYSSVGWHRFPGGHKTTLCKVRTMPVSRPPKTHDDSAPKPVWNDIFIERCAEEIFKCSASLVSPEPLFETIEIYNTLTPHWSTQKNRGFQIQDKEVNNKTVNTIFAAYENVFNAETVNNRLVVALNAFLLKEHWVSYPPKNMNKNNLIEQTAQHYNLFTTGKIVYDYLAEKELIDKINALI